MLSAKPSADTKPKIMPVDKGIAPGRTTISVPMKPTTAAVSRHGVSFSPSINGANTATHLRSPAKRKLDERSRSAAAPSAAEPVPRSSLRLPPSAAFQTKNPQPGHQPRKVNRFPISAASRDFYRLNYPGTSADEWNDWRWQARTRVRTLEELERIFDLSKEERAAALSHKGSLPVGITPYYASLMSRTDASEPLRRTHIMVPDEHIRMPGEEDDPLGEDHDTVVPGLVHRYPDRVLFLTTGFCSTYCRYCTRSRVVGHGELMPQESRLNAAFDYLRRTPQIRDVLISGGDALALSEDRLEWILRATARNAVSTGGQ